MQDILAQHNQRRSELVQKKKKELTLLYLALIKKKFICEINSFVFNGNIIAFLCCITLICQSLLQASYQRSITIKYCITVIAMQQSPAVSTRLLVYLEAVKINCITINEAATCDASLQVLYNAACVKTQHC